jgi:lysophospholipid acyltransferase
MPWLAFIFNMGHMSISHIARQRADDPSAVDITGAQMVLVMKMTAFAWNVADGALPEEGQSDLQKDRRLNQLPSLLDYAGYVFFFPSLLIGPAFDFAEYRRWLDCTMFDVPTNVDPTKKPPTRRKRKIPRSGTPAMWRLAQGLFWIILFLKLSAWYYPQVLLEDGYMKHTFVRRLLVMYLVGFTARAKYYGVWMMAEGSCILAGLGYNGVDPTTGRVSWDRLKNISPKEVELAQNCRGYLAGWNINTNKWLRNYIYLRVTPKGKKPGFRASLATFTTSAFWHGFYPGYYLAFVLASFIQTVAKSKSPLLVSLNGHKVTNSSPDFRRYLRPFFLDPTNNQPLPSKRYYDVLCWFVTQFTFSFAVAPFLILSFSGSLTAWARVYFYAIIGTAASMAFFASPGKAYLKRALAQRVGKKDAEGEDGALRRSESTDSLRSPNGDQETMLGLPSDPDKDFMEAYSEARAEVARRRSLTTERMKELQKGVGNKVK